MIDWSRLRGSRCIGITSPRLGYGLGSLINRVDAGKQPNCEFTVPRHQPSNAKRIFVRAIRTIKDGDELRVRYGPMFRIPSTKGLNVNQSISINNDESMVSDNDDFNGDQTSLDESDYAKEGYNMSYRTTLSPINDHIPSLERMLEVYPEFGLRKLDCFPKLIGPCTWDRFHGCHTIKFSDTIDASCFFEVIVKSVRILNGDEEQKISEQFSMHAQRLRNYAAEFLEFHRKYLLDCNRGWVDANNVYNDPETIADKMLDIIASRNNK
jgi:hypothetical protein